MLLITILAYLTDLLLGEPKRIKHPISFMGDFINFFIKHFYKDSIFQGSMLLLALLLLVFIIVYMLAFLLSFLENNIEIILTALIASTGLSFNMLYKSVKEVIECPNPKDKLALLVSRDTYNMTENEIYKSAIETYSENISDAVIAPLIFLLFGGLYGLFIYKAVSTLDSMVGYKTKKFINFGKASAIMDDILNFIPARITGTIFSLLMLNKGALSIMLKQAKLYESPNAGYPMSAMAACLNIKLGGDAMYQGKIKRKPILGKGKDKLRKNDVYKALKFKKKIDILIIGGLTISWIILSILR